MTIVTIVKNMILVFTVYNNRAINEKRESSVLHLQEGNRNREAVFGTNRHWLQVAWLCPVK